MGVREASAKYRLADDEDSADGGVPRGYKLSEVGVIPEDWLALPFDRLFRRLNGKNYQVLATDYEPYGQLPVIDQGQDLVAGWTDRLEKRFDCPTGGVVVFGDHTRVVKYVSSDFAVGADGTQLLVGSDPESTRFLAYQMQATEIPSAGYSRHFKFLADSFFALPPSACERAQIAEALSDADALIESLQQLIAKKRALKQGAMQALLTGRQRLPGFNEEWEAKPLDALAEIRTGGTPSTGQPDYWGGDLLWCTPTDITALGGRKYLRETARKITAKGLQASSAELIPAGSIVMTSRATIGECAINVVPVTTNQGFKSFVPFDNVDVEFLYYLLLTQTDGFISLCGGSTFLEIGKTQLAGYQVCLPPLKEEQTAIATVLSDMDAEIDALETRLAKTRDLKAGMMQELLTGRIRLPLDQAA